MTNIEKQKLSVVRNYFFELSVVTLAVAVSVLFKMYIDLNNYVRNELTTVVNKNTEEMIILNTKIK